MGCVVTQRYQSPAMAAIHETAQGLHAAGVMDAQTMRRFDEACLAAMRALTPDGSISIHTPDRKEP